MADTTINYDFTIISPDSYIDVNVINANISKIDSILADKVNKVPGKGLSEADFSFEEKQKLEALKNYDDTDVRSQLSELAKRIEELEAVVNG